jgi:ParB-like chromosome segregation protein Spo0J
VGLDDHEREQSRLAGDVSLADRYRSAGLPAASVVRSTKIATIEARHARRIGRLDATTWAEVGAALAGTSDSGRKSRHRKGLR